MTRNFYIGRRLSYGGAACTVRYIGPVQGTKGEWLGVEWDDPDRGKHDGSHQEVKYFECLAAGIHPNPASFVRPTRKQDQTRNFLDALHEKYASDTEASLQIRSQGAVRFNGKIAEEVGFEKIRKQLAALNELKIVILDDMCISGILEKPRGLNRDSKEEVKDMMKKIEETCPKIQELDLSRNLIEDWEDIVYICQSLKGLQTLKLNGSRLNPNLLHSALESDIPSLPTLQRLDLDETLLSWDQVSYLARHTPALQVLSLSINHYHTLSMPPPLPKLRTLTLSWNCFTSTSSIECLTALPSLEELSISHNSITTITPLARPFPTVKSLNLSHNSLPTFSSFSLLPAVFPHLRHLRISQNPVFDDLQPDAAYMLTLGRLPGLRTLNHTRVSEQDRPNADLYYLSVISRELSSTPKEEEGNILAKHPRYRGLCIIYGPPAIVRTDKGAVDPESLEGRLIHFSFHLHDQDKAPREMITKEKMIPRTFDVYRLKGIVGRLFGFKPYCLNLIWETEELDPTAGHDDNENDSLEDSEDEEKHIGGNNKEDGKNSKKDKWTKRELELGNGTREAGFWIEGVEANVRVERKDIWTI
ncbi:MAG: hypothetical protein M1834_001803 [Cirrosporium novae-zelandiae]|nr:MAG: hypothetical protein M1834_001803 [Cirrosporium novae-zelandiae]